MVSVIIIFFNAERFLEEAIESICAQTYGHWELLLVDDGSTDSGREIGKRYARQRPDQIHYFEHPGHRNCGKGASRNLGVRLAQGEYVAFLDADDIWLPNKLAEQVAILDGNKEVGLLYGESYYWYSWSPEFAAGQPDFSPLLGVAVKTPIAPPQLLPLYLRGKAAVPCPSSILVRRSAINDIDGFDETFTGINNIYEDQAFYVKLCLKTATLVIPRIWDWYRQHPESSMAAAWRTGKEAEARDYFLRWTAVYLKEQGIQNREIWLSLQREIWLIKRPSWFSYSATKLFRWAKKWLVKFEEALFPDALSDWLWLRN